MNLIKILDAEISASIKSSKTISVQLVKIKKNVYKGIIPFKVEGDYILNSKTIVDRLVTIEWENSHILIELDSDEEKMNAFLSKDEASLLRAIKQNIKSEDFKTEPSFIVGPPGTGKTKVIAKTIEEARKKDLKVLLVSPTNMAVENVFDRIDTKVMKDDEVVLAIRTEIPSLQAFLPEKIKTQKLEPIEDEIEILEMAKNDLLKVKRNAQPIITKLKSKRESAATLVSNYKKDLTLLNGKLKEARSSLNKIVHRIDALTGNILLKSIASLFTTKKVDELKFEEENLKREILNLEGEIEIITKKIVLAENSNQKAEKDLSEGNLEISEANKALGKISDKLRDLRKKMEELKNNNIFKDAKIVGTTLACAAMNQKIQRCEFDIIICDESSMASIPLLVVAAQSLNEKKNKNITYKDDESLYEAQNQAVRLALKSKLVFVGDPKQLPPIAKTYEMKQSIFNLYNVESIFDGASVNNTIFLDVNFRNHPHITNLASKLFYGGMLKSGKKDDAKDSLFIRRSESKMVSVEGSYINYGNMRIVVSQTQKALERGRRSVGIITPYRKQADLINENLKGLRDEYPDADIQAGTIHKFQGKEKEIIIYDLTFSPLNINNETVPATYCGGYDSDTAKLLNVAMTRAEDFFIVVGDADGIVSLKNNNLILKDWVQEIQNIK